MASGLGLHRVEAELALCRPDVEVGVLDYRTEQPLLVAEIVVDHALVGLRAFGDGVDPRTGEAELRELLPCGIEDAHPGGVGVALARLL